MKKRKLKTLDLATKIRLIAEVEKGTRIKKRIAEEFGIPSNTLSTIWGAREKIKLQYKSLSCSNTVKRKGRFCHIHVENLVQQWLRTKRYTVSTNIIKKKAMEFAKTLNIKRFEATDIWLKRISKIRNKTNTQNLDKESEAGEQNEVQNCQEIQPTLVADFAIVEIKSLPQEVNKNEDDSFDDSTHTMQNSNLNNTEVFSELNHHHGQPQGLITEEAVGHQVQGDSDSESAPEDDDDDYNAIENCSVPELKLILMKNQIKLLKVQIAAGKEQKKAAKAQRRAAVAKRNLNQYQLLLLQRNNGYE